MSAGSQGSVENLKQAMGFLEDAQDVGELLNADLDEMEELQQVGLPVTLSMLCLLCRNKIRMGCPRPLQRPALLWMRSVTVTQ
jgi:hypothetical protein